MSTSKGSYTQISDIGLKVWPAGRIGEDPSIGLSKSLKSSGFKLARLKTGKK